MKKSLKKWQGVACVIGVDFGDSGKGRLIDDLAQTANIVARYSGGSNTGHTVKNKYGKFALHVMPSGIFNKKTICIIGRGVAVDLESLVDDEMRQLKKAKVSWKNLQIDEQATLTMPWHNVRDSIRENFRTSKVGTTQKGVGPTYADRLERVGLRVKDLQSPDFKYLLKLELDFQNKFYQLNISYKETLVKFLKYQKIIKPCVSKTIPLVKKYIDTNKNVLFEGAQGWFLDIDSGTYPFVTSSNPGVIGITRSFDVHPSRIKHIIGITKAYLTRVGNGPLPTRIETKEKDIIIEKGQEIGTTSGRTRDPGWLDLVLLKAACDANAVNHLALTKLDVFSNFKKIRICTKYTQKGKTVGYLSGDSEFLSNVSPNYHELDGWQEDLSHVRTFSALPKNAQKFVQYVENYLRVPVSFIGVGPERDQAIYE